MNGRGSATASSEALSRMIAEPLAAGSSVPKRHREMAAGISRWFASATWRAREVFAVRFASCWAAVGPDLRLLRCLHLCQAAERPGSVCEGVLIAALTLDGRPLRDLVQTSLLLAKMARVEELRWALDVLIDMLISGGDAVGMLLEGDCTLTQQVVDMVECALTHASPQAAKILLLLTRVTSSSTWSGQPEWRSRLLAATMRMLEAAGPSAGADVTTPLHSALQVALEAFDPKHLGTGSWAQDVSRGKQKQVTRRPSSAGAITRTRVAVPPAKRWAKCVHNPQSCRLTKADYFLTEL